MSTTRKMSLPEAREVCAALLAQHDKTDWVVAIDRHPRRHGVTDYARKTITLSSLSLNTRSYGDSLNTIRHEVAHVLTAGHRHDNVWRRCCISLGGDGQRTHYGASKAQLETLRVAQMKAQTCPVCGLMHAGEC